jgi:hypothetical protein
MAEILDPKTGRSSGPPTPARAPGADDFPGDFTRVKQSVIRPALENIATTLIERGDDINISEDAHGMISIHIVPAGVNKSIHAYDWFPTFSFLGAPSTKTITLQGRNARRNSEGAPASRGDYKPGQINKEIVEKEVKKFIGEIANW